MTQGHAERHPGIEDQPDLIIREIGNFYGNLCLLQKDGVEYWSIKNYSGFHWVKCDPRIAAVLREVYRGESE